MDEDDAEAAVAGVSVFVHVPLPMYRRLWRAAEAERCTMAQVVRTALEVYLPAGDRS